jgi:hypothetical protein
VRTIHQGVTYHRMAPPRNHLRGARGF